MNHPKTPPPSEPEDFLWVLYETNGKTTEIRNRIAEHYLPYLMALSRHLERAFRGAIDSEEIQSIGHVCLLEAIYHFRLGDKASFRTYLTRILWRAVTKELKRAGVPFRASLMIGMDGVAAEDEREAISYSDFQQLAANLSPPQRRCIWMRYWGGQSDREIAWFEDRPPGWVNDTITAGLDQLRKELGPEG